MEVATAAAHRRDTHVGTDFLLSAKEIEITSPLSIAITMLLSFSTAMAGPYRALYVFGDSYSDIGARYLDADGPTAAAYLAQYMGISLTYPQDAASQGKSLDFAASGAVTGKEPGYPGYIVHGTHWCCQGMEDQVEDFVRRVQNGSISFDPQSTLFFVAGGLNDGGFPTSITIRNLTRQILLLKGVGAYHISLALLPTKIPNFSAVGRRLNPAYHRLVSTLRSRLAIDIRLNHWGMYFDEIISQPFRYGILNTTSKCAGRALFKEDDTPCEDPKAYYYYHESHPSMAVHRIVGAKLYDEITRESESGTDHVDEPVSRRQRRDSYKSPASSAKPQTASK